MTTIIINEKTKKGKIILDLVREMGVGRIIEEKKTENRKLNNVTKQAVKEANEGKTTKCKSFDDYLKKVQ
jgi:hypothetical protein